MSAVERAPLSDVERNILATQETTIERGGQQINAALACIREQRLYRETHPTFEDYCQERWGMTRSTANRRILAIEVSTVLEPMGAKVNSRQARALSGLDPDEQRATYERAREQSGSDSPTAAQIKAARPHCPGVETHPREDHSAPGPTDSDASSPAPEPFPEPTPEAQERAAAEADAQISRETFSKNLARSVHLLSLYGTKANAPKEAVTSWESSQDIYYQPTTAARMREAADYLYAVAEEWPA